jgi:FtsP/CotA-like multicopper oxidase with cupredoxin domain
MSTGAGREMIMTKRPRRLGTALAAACALLLATAGAGQAAGVGMACTPGGPTYDLVAKTGYIETPDGNSVFMWSLANQAVNSGRFQAPGPVLCVTEGQTVRITLHNTLNVPTSLVFPGQDDVSVDPADNGSEGLFAREAPAGGTVTYTFHAAHPGTFLYESGTDQSKQLEMGLYGALVVRPSGFPDRVYSSAATRFDPSREYLVLLNDIDPDLHHAVETSGTYDFNALHNRYFAVNGREFPDSIQDNNVSWLPNQPYGALVRLQPYSASNDRPALIRMLNLGALNHPFHPHGNHLRQVGQDGRPFDDGASAEHFGETIGSGQTQDYLMAWTDQDSWDPSSNKFPADQTSNAATKPSVATLDYRHLTFKDGDTYFSGSAYLGLKGTLPTGTVSHNLCGEWYFPWHSHALNEFSNFDQGFGGMATLLRIDPRGGCTGYPTATTLVGAQLKSGSYTALGADDGTSYQVNPKTTTLRAGVNSTVTSLPVTSASGFPPSDPSTADNHYVKVDNEIMQVTGGQGTTTWTVSRHALGTSAAAHSINATVSALATDWYAGFSGVPAGSLNLKLTYKGKNCGSTTSLTCTAIGTPTPQQTVKICNWKAPSANGCTSVLSPGWETLPAPPAQPQDVGSTDVPSTWTVPAASASTDYIGTGSNKGLVRVLVHTARWTSPPSPATFSTWGNVMKLVYDAP